MIAMALVVILRLMTGGFLIVSMMRTMGAQAPVPFFGWHRPLIPPCRSG